MRTTYSFRKPDNLFVATNLDPQFPRGEKLWPGGGSMVAALRHSTEREPLVAGKPSPLLFELISDQVGTVDRSRAIIFGDRLTTDILFGVDSGIRSCMVLSGVETRDTLAASTLPAPTFLVDSIGTFESNY
eukprot:TRINITY_DN2218_c0_g1_i1.p3 TRINITY_DN2218_c0_g1~~TRINITY_DN2218_c0_g1_i1.p3  ORF type:complete len:131 (-),score=55.67 TRINITY_DN2218_c0_g1_i1:21-413(-)